jgi:hypothetical protein
MLWIYGQWCAVVVSIDEKSQTPSARPDPAGYSAEAGEVRNPHARLQRPRYDDLFGALSVLDGKVIGPCVPRHRHQEFIRFIGESPCASATALVVNGSKAARAGPI